MNIVIATITPIIEILATLGFIALVVTPIYIFIEKTKMGGRIKAATPWVGWTYEEPVEDPYTNFVIHPSNYIKVPTSR